MRPLCDMFWVSVGCLVCVLSCLVGVVSGVCAVVVCFVRFFFVVYVFLVWGVRVFVLLFCLFVGLLS